MRRGSTKGDQLAPQNELEMLSTTEQIIRAIVWSLLGTLPGWTIGRWIGISKFGGYFGRTATALGPSDIVYPGIAALIGALLGWFVGTLLNTWPKTRSLSVHFSCWAIVLFIWLMLEILCPVIPSR